MQFVEDTTSTENITLANISTTDVCFGESKLHYGPYEFIRMKPEIAIVSLVIMSLEAVIRTFGNIVTVLVFAIRSDLRRPEHIFMINLAISDLYVTSVADPMAIIAKIEGKEYFDKFPGLCQTIGSLCTVSCFSSLSTIGLMSINRYVCICANDKYARIFSKRNCIIMCVLEYLIGSVFVLLNLAHIGEHTFDHKALECIWDRMKTYPYTVVFFVVLVWVPSVVIGICYLEIFFFVKAHGKRMTKQNISNARVRSFHLAKTLFLIYAVFVTCWAPFAILAVVDAKNAAPHEVYVVAIIFAHLHPSVNWLIYYKTNTHFASGFRYLFSKCRHSDEDGRSATKQISTINSVEFSKSLH